MGALSEGIKTGLGVSQFLGQRQQLQRQSGQLDIQNKREDEDRQIEAAGIEFENAANFIKGGYAGYSPAGVRAFSKAQFTLMRRVGGDHLKNVTFEQVLAGNMANKRNMKDFRDLIIKSGDAAAGQDEDTRGEILERVSEIAGGIYSPFGAPGQERQAEVQQEQLLAAQEQQQASLNLQNIKQSLGFEPVFDPQGIETDGVTVAQRVPPTALQIELDKPENALLKEAITNEITRLEGGGEDEGRLTTLTDELRKGAEGGAGSGAQFVNRGKRVSEIQLALGIEDLSSKKQSVGLTEDESKELRILTKAQERVSKLTPGEKVASRLTAKEETQLDQRITPDKLARTLDPATFKPVPARIDGAPITNRQASDMFSAVIATTKQMEEMADLAGLRGTVDILGTLALKAITAESATGAAFKGAKLKAAAIAKADAVAATYLSQREAYLDQVGRVLGGQRGVLTDQDVQRVKSAFPSLRDTAEIAKVKMALIEFFITNAEFAKKQKVFGLLNDRTYEARKSKALSNLEAFNDPRDVDVSGTSSLPIQGQGGTGLAAPTEDFSGKTDEEINRILNE